jgi:pyruvate formate lyase activating enzyme
MLGIKTWGAEKHRALTGMDIEHTLVLAKRLAKLGRPMWVRFVLVPGLTDDMADIRGIAEFAAGLGNVERVEVLPFHQMGKFKWERLKRPYTLNDTLPPTVEACEQACDVFRKAGLTAY